MSTTSLVGYGLMLFLAAIFAGLVIGAAVLKRRDRRPTRRTHE